MIHHICEIYIYIYVYMIVYVVHHLDACVFSAFYKVILRKSWLLGSRYKTVNMFFDEQRCGNKQQLQILHVHKKQGQPPHHTPVFFAKEL